MLIKKSRNVILLVQSAVSNKSSNHSDNDILSRQVSSLSTNTHCSWAEIWRKYVLKNFTQPQFAKNTESKSGMLLAVTKPTYSFTCAFTQMWSTTDFTATENSREYPKTSNTFQACTKQKHLLA